MQLSCGLSPYTIQKGRVFGLEMTGLLEVKQWSEKKWRIERRTAEITALRSR
jgi:hypothetical protein